jgi:DNA-3-methyladenine glycosylase II
MSPDHVTPVTPSFALPLSFGATPSSSAPADGAPAPLTPGSVALAAADLARRDEDLGRLLDRNGPPPLWARPPGFATLARVILEQQVSLASARAVYRRLGARAGRVTPGRMLALGPRRLRACGLTRQKAAYILHLAEAIEGGALDLRAVARLEDAAAHAALVQIKGIGRWTADVYLLMALRRPDVWPVGDIALVNTLRAVKRMRAVPSAERVARLADSWRPHRSVAARMLWHHYLSGGLD